eukprot:670638-Heterocapsa_arctica.AAC.1
MKWTISCSSRRIALAAISEVLAAVSMTWSLAESSMGFMSEVSRSVTWEVMADAMSVPIEVVMLVRCSESSARNSSEPSGAIAAW